MKKIRDNISDLDSLSAEELFTRLLSDLPNSWSGRAKIESAIRHYGMKAFDIFSHFQSINRAKLIQAGRRFPIAGNKINRKLIFLELNESFGKLLFSDSYKNSELFFLQSQRTVADYKNSRISKVLVKNGAQDSSALKEKHIDANNVVLTVAAQNTFLVLFGLTEIIAYCLTNFNESLVSSAELKRLTRLRGELRAVKDHHSKLLSNRKSINQIKIEMHAVDIKLVSLENKVEKQLKMRKSAFEGFVRENLTTFVTSNITNSKKKFKTKRNLPMKQLVDESIKKFSNRNFKIYQNYLDDISPILKEIERRERLRKKLL